MPDNTQRDGSRFSIDCLSRLLFDPVANKWSMRIMTVLNGGGTRFNELKRRLEEVSQKSLSMTIKRPEQNGIIGCTIVPSPPPGVLYEMTPLDLTLLSPFQAIYPWVNDNVDGVEGARVTYDSDHRAN